MIDTQQKILDTAERLFGEQGYAATSLRQVIAAAEVNVAAVHYHFGSKEDLLDAVVMRKAGPLTQERLARLEAVENTANAKPGPRTVPGRAIPVPSAASPEMQAIIAAPYRLPNWNADPKSPAEWKELISRLAAAAAGNQKAVRENLGVSMESSTIGGVKVFILTPTDIPPANRKRLLVHVHGGGYVYNPGEAGTGEATLMAAYGGFKVISIDYRMPPDFPYPAAMDDAMAVWKEVVKMQDPRNVAIFGTSTGGGMTPTSGSTTCW